MILPEPGTNKATIIDGLGNVTGHRDLPPEVWGKIGSLAEAQRRKLMLVKEQQECSLPFYRPEKGGSEHLKSFYPAQQA